MRTMTQILTDAREGGFDMLTSEEIAQLAPPCQETSQAGRTRLEGDLVVKVGR